ncbi:MAG: hypothetical protein K4445_10210 [Deltaproteobacteria bacterium]|jgi:cobalamin biosynthesis protein CobD/CbiB|nr:hypothetical protein [Syntrophaceae bacterium]
MKIISESMNQSFGGPAAALILILPPVVSAAVVLALERKVGILLGIILFPVIYVLSLLATLCAITVLTRPATNKRTAAPETDLEERVRRLEQLAGRLALENELLKKALQAGLGKEPGKNDAAPGAPPSGCRTPPETKKNITR